MHDYGTSCFSGSICFQVTYDSARIYWQTRVPPRIANRTTEQTMLFTMMPVLLRIGSWFGDVARKYLTGHLLPLILITIVSVTLSLICKNALVGSNDSSVTGNTWLYVSTIGSDSYSCRSAASPCASILGASQKATAGTTIKVAPGTYPGGSQTNVSGTENA